jgi:hypothetical protein
MPAEPPRVTDEEAKALLQQGGPSPGEVERICSTDTEAPTGSEPTPGDEPSGPASVEGNGI